MPTYIAHGVRVTLDSNWPRFLALVTMNCASFSLATATEEFLDVQVTLERKKWFARPQPSDRPKIGEEKWGSEVFVDGGTVRLRSELLSVEFTTGPRSTVRARYLVDRRTQIARLYKDVPSWETCQKVMRLALHQPVFHMLEKRGIQMLHAAAAARSGEAVLILGLNGAGKSSLCFALLDSFDYMSDNYVMWNGREVLGFPEAMRLPVSSGLPGPAKTPIVFGKKVTPIMPGKTVLRARPGAIFILTQGLATSLAPLPPREALRRIGVIHDMTHEFPRHSFLGPFAGTEKAGSLADLVSSVPTFALTMSDVKEASALVLDHL